VQQRPPNPDPPVKPIVYWIDPATSPKWIPCIRKGVEAWQSAFEVAGFKNAIVAKDPPSPEEDPDWSPEDARYSLIRWLPSTTENAFGPSIQDPRTGEILEADIELHQNIVNLIRDRYFVQVSPLDPRAQKLPLPDDLMGKLLQFVVSHEVGHTIGFQHNMRRVRRILRTRFTIGSG
jgi:Met-zincin